MNNKIVAVVLLALACAASLSAADLTLWYQQPVGDLMNEPLTSSPGQPPLGMGGGKGSHAMNEALPIGNGRMGALIFGAPERERISLNEDSLWTGTDNPSGDDGTMGSYQVLGNLFINLPAHTNSANYRRDLDLGDAIAHVSYSANGVNFQRKYFSSHPAEVTAAQFTADKIGAYTGSIGLRDGHGAKVVLNGNRFTVSGALSNGRKYEWQVLVLNHGGTITADTNSANLVFKDCDRLTLLVAAGTDYVMDFAKNYHGDDPHARVAKRIDAAAEKSFATIEAAHIKDYHALFNRVSADFGQSSAAQTALPTDQRKLEAFKTADPGLEALLFQYGRYLLISCSRPGGLPANLQGLWNDNNSPAWHSDYHANINVQMNYWPAEVANLGECHTPFFDLIASQLPACARRPRPRRSSKPPMEILPSAGSPSAPRTTSPAAWAGSGTRRRMPGIASICGNITRSASTKIISAPSPIRL